MLGFETRPNQTRERFGGEGAGRGFMFSGEPPASVVDGFHTFYGLASMLIWPYESGE